MKLAIVGTGYVGLVQGACFADTGNDVICVDVDEKKIRDLKKGIVPIYEPGLEELVRTNLQEGRLDFTTFLKSAVERSDVIFLCLPTPQTENGAADLQYILRTSEEIASYVNGYKIIASKSTAPVGTVDKIKQIVRKKAKHEADVVSNPEFMKEGSAVQDSMKPDRIVIGSKSKRAVSMLAELYDPFVRTGHPILVMDERSAEMTKYAANAFLATKISFMNEIANLCERVGANVDWVRKAIGADSRIGSQFLFPGVGYGGSCLPKDVKALRRIAEEHEYDFKILRAVDEVNERQQRILLDKLARFFNHRLKNRTIAVWGVSFKPRTDDIREAPSLVMINGLLEAGARVRTHDPVALKPARILYDGRIDFYENNYEALKGADALVIMTEWNEFRRPDYEKMKSLMKQPVIFDGRNVYDPKEMKEKGFTYFGIGR